MRIIVRLFRSYRITASYEKYASFNPSPLSLKQLADFGSKSGSQEVSFQFLRKELPVRLANIMKEISLLPDNLLQMPSVSLVMNWYEQSFRELIHFEATNRASEKVLNDFTDTLVHIRNRHSNVVETMAQGILEMKEAHGIDVGTENRIQYFLDRFYMSRISIRMLINQHTLLFGSQLASHPRHIGCIDPNCNVKHVIEDAYENAKFLCEQYYLVAPDLHMECKNISDSGKPCDVSIVYVPSHLYHMLFELFKNAMRACVEYHSASSDVPPINILISKGNEDLVIRVSDLGGGIPRSKLDLLFLYMYSTAPQPARSDSVSAPLAGYGYGLPLSRLYARYFQGDLILSTVEGHGTDAHIYLKVMSNEANELLPVYNRTASKVYAQNVPVNDWSSPHPFTPASAPQRNFTTCTKHRVTR